MFLVDTSVWIQTFRTAPRIRIEDALDFDDIVTCLPVVQEVLQGFRDDRAYAVARESMRSLPLVESPLSISVVDDAVGLYRQARRAGLTIRSGVDCLIAACAIRHNLTVLHHDRDFDALARIAPLSAKNI